jgi:hypothetical protein
VLTAFSKTTIPIVCIDQLGVSFVKGAFVPESKRRQAASCQQFPAHTPARERESHAYTTSSI